MACLKQIVLTIFGEFVLTLILLMAHS